MNHFPNLISKLRQKEISNGPLRTFVIHGILGLQTVRNGDARSVERGIISLAV